MRYFVFPLTAIALLGTTSCARNTIVLDRATTMGQAGRTTTAGTEKVLDELRRTNRDVRIDLAATDPNCDLQRPQRIADGRVRDGSVLCRAGSPQPGDIEVRRWRAEELKPSLAVIEGVAAYLGAVDAIVTRKPVDIAAEITEAETKLRTIADALNAVAGTPAVPAITDDQRNAIRGTLDLLSELLDEAQRVGDLRRFELGADPDAFSRSVAALEGVNERAIDRLGVQLQNQLTLINRQLVIATAAGPQARRPIVTRQLDVIEAREALPDLRAALRNTVQAFDAAHTAYRDLLLNRDARLTPAEQRKAAGIAQARVLAALSNLVSVVKAF